ncbi:hypothetical protein EGR_06919 [Echinococcus granulosus]|uniref:Uncharacterized protein n=1 Tax=Echinococcus granulosus TaxID=6210 RepID=W6UAR7_ECHGR|nr:hypothetical protein EGR_06919 [Echinococcus granulosus]EUB58175.1 hypothetical protein EGR_06919 [Echinococcus granulosus]
MRLKSNASGNEIAAGQYLHQRRCESEGQNSPPESRNSTVPCCLAANLYQKLMRDTSILQTYDKVENWVGTCGRREVDGLRPLDGSLNVSIRRHALIMCISLRNKIEVVILIAGRGSETPRGMAFVNMTA